MVRGKITPVKKARKPERPRGKGIGGDKGLAEGLRPKDVPPHVWYEAGPGNPAMTMELERIRDQRLRGGTTVHGVSLNKLRRDAELHRMYREFKRSV